MSILRILCGECSCVCPIAKSVGIISSPKLIAVRHRQGRLIGRMQALGFPLQEEAVLKTLTEDVLKSSEIEGEILDRDQVRSSIARRLESWKSALCRRPTGTSKAWSR